MALNWTDVIIAGLAVVAVGQQLWVHREGRRSRQREELFQIITENAADMIALVDAKGRRLYNSPSYKRVLGYSPRELADKSSFEQIHPDDRFRVLEAAREARETGIGREVEYRIRHKNGEWRVLESSASTIRDRNGNVEKLVIVNRDVTDRKRAEERLEHESFHDSLTGLPNRRLFLDRLGHALARARRNPAVRFAVLLVNVDGFHDWNHDLGSEKADQLIVDLARRISASVREDDSVASTRSTASALESVSRLSGDEFSVLLEGISEASDALRVARRIQRAAAEPLADPVSERHLTVSVGIGLNDQDVSCEDLLRDLDTAMRRAKALGGNGCEIFDHTQHACAAKRLSQETELRRALEQLEFCVYYQPVVRLAGRDLVGFEALLRWQHPEEGTISPDKFIETADDAGLLVEIGAWLLEDVCQTVRRWTHACELPDAFSVSVNLSARQLADAGLVGHFQAALSKSRANPSLLSIEFAETAAMRNPQQTAAILADLRHAGIAAVLDNFGAGPSSLKLLTQLPLKSLKLDRSLVQGMQSDRVFELLVTMILSVARSANLPVIGEGIEDHGQSEKLRQLGGDMGQGFLFSKPLTADEAGQWLLAEARVSNGLDRSLR